MIAPYPLPKSGRAKLPYLSVVDHFTGQCRVLTHFRRPILSKCSVQGAKEISHQYSTNRPGSETARKSASRAPRNRYRLDGGRCGLGWGGREAFPPLPKGTLSAVAIRLSIRLFTRLHRHRFGKSRIWSRHGSAGGLVTAR
jgi:hypothetical protein